MRSAHTQSTVALGITVELGKRDAKTERLSACGTRPNGSPPVLPDGSPPVVPDRMVIRLWYQTERFSRWRRPQSLLALKPSTREYVM
ncbi:unnamed protein product [Arctogadus glacialis]